MNFRKGYLHPTVQVFLTSDCSIVLSSLLFVFSYFSETPGTQLTNHYISLSTDCCSTIVPFLLSSFSPFFSCHDFLITSIISLSRSSSVPCVTQLQNTTVTHISSSAWKDSPSSSHIKMLCLHRVDDTCSLIFIYLSPWSDGYRRRGPKEIITLPVELLFVD